MNKRNEKTKRLISIAFYSLLLKRRFDDITISDICKKANVSRMSFYRHYNSKEDIFVVFSDERFAEFFDDVVRRQEPTLEAFINSLFVYFKTYSRQILILVQSKKENILVEQFKSYCRYLFSGSHIKNFSIDKNNSQSITFFATGLCYTLLHWVENGLQPDINTISKEVIKLLTKGLLYI